MKLARAALFVMALFVVGIPTAANAETVVPTTPLPCNQVIDTSGPPYSGWTKVLGKVWLPRHTLGSGTTDDVADGERHWFKQGLAIRAGSTLTLTVPDAWRGRLAIGWGSPAQPSEQVTIDGCRYARGKWLAYAGGYWVDRPACVPLVVSSGARRTTVHIPLGEDCPSA